MPSPSYYEIAQPLFLLIVYICKTLKDDFAFFSGFKVSLRFKIHNFAHNGKDRREYMTGFVFFGLAWAGWIYSTFIMEKTNPYRFPIAAYLLVTIILSVFKIRFLGLDISLATLFLLFISFLTFIKLPFWKLLYCTIGIFIVSSATAVFYLISLYDPVWIFIDQQILLSFLGACLAVLLFKEYKARIFSTIIGLIQGDILYAIILKKFSIDFPIGSFAFLDGLTLTCVFITIWSGFEYLQTTFEHKNFQQKKEKQL